MQRSVAEIGVIGAGNLAASIMETQLCDLQFENLFETSSNYDNAERDINSSFPNGANSKYYTRWSPVEEGITCSWNDLSIYSLEKCNGRKNYKQIINGVTGIVKAGSLVALMGASGAGKTTLMSALAYRQTADMIVQGKILINGCPVGDYMRNISGYMHQDDLFVESLTVLEHMNLMAKLKLDRRIPAEEKQRKIHKILKNLGLLQSLHTRIGSKNGNKTLSGGERKRLSFAAELLIDPPILFCDEPTTGLDSYSADKLVTIMKELSENGTTILCTIHQPSSQVFAKFSEIILVAEGRIAYMGEASNALKFFEEMDCRCPSTYNPADFFIKTLAITPGYEDSSRMAIKKICDRFVVSEHYKEVEFLVRYQLHLGNTTQGGSLKIRNNIKHTFWIAKFCCLTRRWFVDMLRTPSVYLLRLLQKLVIGLMIGLCYLGTDRFTQNGVQSVQGAIFVIVSENTFIPMYAILSDFPENTPLFLREHKSGLYSPLLYYTSRIMAMLPGLIIDPILFTIIAYWLADLKRTFFAFMMTMLIAILTINVSGACGIFFSNAFDSVPVAMLFLVSYDYVLMVTSGPFIKLSTLPYVISWTKYLSWLMYSSEVLSILQWEGVTNITCSGPANLPCNRDGLDVLETYSFKESHLYWDIGILVVMCFVFHILALTCIIIRARK